jgi:hypothetical protein
MSNERNKMYRQPSHAEVARRAKRDPRTVDAFLAGAPVRPSCAAAISRAIAELANEMAADLEAHQPAPLLSICSAPRVQS